MIEERFSLFFTKEVKLCYLLDDRPLMEDLDRLAYLQQLQLWLYRLQDLMLQLLQRQQQRWQQQWGRLALPRAPALHPVTQT